MDVETEAAGEALNHGDRPAATRRDALLLGSTALMAHDGAHEHAEHSATQLVVPREQVAQALREGEHPLAHRDRWKNCVYQMRGALDHAPTVAARTDPASLARQGHKSVVRAALTAKTRKAAREHAATEEATHAALDECGQRRAAGARRHVLEEGLEVVAQHAVQHRGLGVTRLVAGGIRWRHNATTDRMGRERICSGRWQHAARPRSPRAIRIRAESHGLTAREGGGRHGEGWRPASAAFEFSLFHSPRTAPGRPLSSGEYNYIQYKISGRS
jgi:hypothetical protein